MNLPVQAAGIRRDWTAVRVAGATRAAVAGPRSDRRVAPSANYYCCGQDSTCANCSTNPVTSKDTCCPTADYYYKTSTTGPCQSCR